MPSSLGRVTLPASLRSDHGRQLPETVGGINRNRWTPSIGITGRHQPELVDGFTGIRSLAAQLKEQAWKAGKWNVIGNLREGKNAATYSTQSFQEELNDRKYRFIVVRSSALDKRKAKSIDCQLTAERTRLEKEAAMFSKQIYYCRPNAEHALAAFLKEHHSTYASFKGVIEEMQVTQRPPGRPKKGATYPVETQFATAVTVSGPDAKLIKELYERESTFILITGLENDVWSDAEVLHEYKE